MNLNAHEIINFNLTREGRARSKGVRTGEEKRNKRFFSYQVQRYLCFYLQTLLIFYVDDILFKTLFCSLVFPIPNIL